MAKGKKTTAAPKAAAPKTEEVKKGGGRFSLFAGRGASKRDVVEVSLGGKQRDCSSCTNVLMHVMFHHRGCCMRARYLGTDLWHSRFISRIRTFRRLGTKISSLASQRSVRRGTSPCPHTANGTCGQFPSFGQSTHYATWLWHMDTHIICFTKHW